ncbi:MAG TPA: hypothetical protein VN924_28350 [Bryobacteraceae bacterium]|nr:hypothetical protein [Bryobacteraceae bacterium]
MYKSSNRRIRASRANGARSRGPRTAGGKARSSQNAIRHGLLAKCVVMAGESSPGFDALLYQHQARFAPADGVDQGYVEEMAAATWRIRRAWAMETRLFDDAVAAQPPGDERGRMAAALGRLAPRPEFALLQRYETRLHMHYQRALHNFLLVRAACIPNEPSPIPEHSAPIAPSPPLPLAHSSPLPPSPTPL